MPIIAYVGIDAHEETLVVCGLAGDADRPTFRLTLRNDAVEVKRAFLKLSETYDLRCCYEASSGGYVLHRWLGDLGIKCDVVAPSLIPQKAGDKIKTDKRDAFGLATMYRSRMLTTIFVPTPEQESDRAIIRYRTAVLKDVVESKNMMNKFLTSHGIRNPFKSRWTQKYWAWIKKLAFPESDAFVWTQMIGLLEFKLSVLETMDAKLAGCAQKSAYKERVDRLCCLRGIGTLTALTLILELVDIRRFSHARALMAYIGLTPREHSSGKSRRQGGITKAGNPHLRRVMVEAGWKYAAKPAIGSLLKARQKGQPAEVVAHSWKAQNRLHKKFWSIAARKQRSIAVVAAARELVGFVWAILTTTPVAAA